MERTLPFKSAVSAWFWFMDNRNKPPSDEGICQPVDITMAVHRLYGQGILSFEQIEIMKKYGARGRSPDPRLEEERDHWRIWRDAMSCFEVELVRLGIVERRARRHG